VVFPLFLVLLRTSVLVSELSLVKLATLIKTFCFLYKAGLMTFCLKNCNVAIPRFAW
jgi:hypothetical protein